MAKLHFLACFARPLKSVGKANRMLPSFFTTHVHVNDFSYGWFDGLCGRCWHSLSHDMSNKFALVQLSMASRLSGSACSNQGTCYPVGSAWVWIVGYMGGKKIRFREKNDYKSWPLLNQSLQVRFLFHNPTDLWRCWVSLHTLGTGHGKGIRYDMSATYVFFFFTPLLAHKMMK